MPTDKLQTSSPFDLMAEPSNNVFNTQLDSKKSLKGIMDSNRQANNTQGFMSNLKGISSLNNNHFSSNSINVNFNDRPVQYDNNGEKFDFLAATVRNPC